jgi:hypothetical protein
MRVKNRLLKKNKLRNLDHKHKCPVYLCKFRDKTEDGLLIHYNSIHADLVDLGIRLLKSKDSRESEKTKIYLNTEKDDHKSIKSAGSFSEMND